MNNQQRPLSPFMLGPYYRPQLTSMMSIAHRASGVVLSVLGAPLFLWWLVALGSGPEAYRTLLRFFDSWVGQAALAVTALCLSYHFLNGIRHLVWDTGRALDLRSAYTGGWLVLIVTVIATAALLGIVL
ncbi:MAG: succinate dehydrogenase, cytochrome b556 subunit [Xanthomonadales bacterium]|nr:succinate dehydrogenase, cytochrome b556 subunit [Xanthomonadales bacterium]